MKTKVILLALALGASIGQLAAQDENTPRETPPASDVTRIPVSFTDGYHTDPRDHGRPVVLIAAALGVAPEVFRDAFSRVHPANPNIGPTGDEARHNKAALLNALGKYGVTNERLDAVSDYYRYVRSRRELWRHRPAVAFALVRNGAVIGYEVVDGGSGYSSPPVVSAPGITNLNARVELVFGETLEKNGSISTITVTQTKN